MESDGRTDEKKEERGTNYDGKWKEGRGERREKEIEERRCDVKMETREMLKTQG